MQSKLALSEEKLAERAVELAVAQKLVEELQTDKEELTGQHTVLRKDMAKLDTQLATKAKKFEVKCCLIMLDFSPTS